ncbi:MAG: hypothetical protein CMJ45_02360 [Planctomyces sp.]|nr:hypothetical protein [Planctomyces sp.]
MDGQANSRFTLQNARQFFKRPRTLTPAKVVLLLLALCLTALLACDVSSVQDAKDFILPKPITPTFTPIPPANTPTPGMAMAMLAPRQAIRIPDLALVVESIDDPEAACEGKTGVAALACAKGIDCNGKPIQCKKDWDKRMSAIARLADRRCGEDALCRNRFPGQLNELASMIDYKCPSRGRMNEGCAEILQVEFEKGWDSFPNDPVEGLADAMTKHCFGKPDQKRCKDRFSNAINQISEADGARQEQSIDTLSEYYRTINLNQPGTPERRSLFAALGLGAAHEYRHENRFDIVDALKEEDIFFGYSVTSPVTGVFTN